MLNPNQKRALYDGVEGEDEKRLAKVSLIIILLFLVGSGLIIFMDIVWGDRTLWALLSAGCFSQLIPIYLLYKGRFEAGSFIAVGIYIFFATASAVIGQGIRDYVLIVYPSIILFAGLTLKRRGMIIATALTLLALAWLTFGDIYDLYTPQKANPANSFDFFILGILIVVSSAGVHLLIENLEYSHLKTKTELSERKKAEARLHESEESFKEIFENSPDNIFVFDVYPENKFRVKKINSALEKIFNTERVNIEGKYLDEILDAKSSETISANFRRCIETKSQVQYDEFANLSKKSYSTSLFPIIGENGEVVRLIGISRDITRLKDTESHLRESETRFRLLFETMVQGVILQSASGEIISANPAAESVLGLTSDEMKGHTFMDLRWKAIREDGSEFPSNEHPAMIALGTGQEVRNVVMGVFNRQTQDYRWINIHAVPQFKNGEQKPYQVYTTFDDMTIRKLIEKALKASETRYRLLAEKISDVIWIYDINENRTRYISPSVERLRGYTPEEVIAGNMEDALAPDSFQYVQKSMAARLEDFRNGKREFYVDELEQTRKNGSTVWTEATTNFQVNSENGHIEIYGVSRDITERKLNERILLQANQELHNHIEKIEQLRQELYEQASHDPLTGLFNRRHMDEFMRREFSRAEREKYPISVIMLDMDGLKLINDKFGHPTGDMCLLAISSCLKKFTRLEDTIGRYGGDEFNIMMSNTTENNALERIKKWQGYLAEHPITTDDGKSIVIKFTAGIASYPKHGTNLDEVIKYADKALYLAKESGRNNVRLYE